MSRRVRFDDEADAEYRFTGRWYEARREHLGLEFFEAVDATINQIVAMPRSGPLVRQLPAELSVRRRAVAHFPYHVVYMELASHIRCSPLRTTAGSQGTGKTAWSNWVRTRAGP